jgi:hypothetical protein
LVALDNNFELVVLTNPGIYARDLKSREASGFSPKHQHVGLKPRFFSVIIIPSINAGVSHGQPVKAEKNYD